MADVTELTIYIKSEIFDNTDVQEAQANGVTYQAPVRDAVADLIEHNGISAFVSKTFCAIDIFEIADVNDLTVHSMLYFRVQDANAAIPQIEQLAKASGIDVPLTFAIGATYPDPDDENQHWKSIEIYYDVNAIPDGYESPLNFRNEAMELIEAALEEADAGEWSGAESGAGEVNFGFDVTNFSKAERVARKAVEGTAYDCIREITRFDSEKDLPPETLAELGMG